MVNFELHRFICYSKGKILEVFEIGVPFSLKEKDREKRLKQQIKDTKKAMNLKGTIKEVGLDADLRKGEKWKG